VSVYQSGASARRDRAADGRAPDLRAAARTTDKHRFSSCVATSGLTSPREWSFAAEATQAAARMAKEHTGDIAKQVPVETPLKPQEILQHAE
jgi:hypothetical protein